MKQITIQDAPKSYIMHFKGRAIKFINKKAIMDDETADAIMEIAKKKRNPYYHVRTIPQKNSVVIPKPKTPKKKR